MIQFERFIFRIVEKEKKSYLDCALLNFKSAQWIKNEVFELIITWAYIAPGFWEEAYTEK